ncbi:hypothetical protein TNCV_559631 [Trichonephila clavipes]|nr:hypothetical protein TNCV_559631 [Trichonephila clavipes]
MNKRTIPLSFPYDCQTVGPQVVNYGKTIQTAKTKKGKRARGLRENPSRNKIGKRNGYGHELVIGVSWVRVLVPLKTRHIEEADARQICQAQSPPAGVECQLWCLPRNE